MATAADTENLRPLFKKILQSRQLAASEVKRDRSQIIVSDRGQFFCCQCNHTWRSMFSWITFDLKELEIVYRWRMKCRGCLMLCLPMFTIPQLEAMFEKAVKCYKGEHHVTCVNIGYSGRKSYRDPHRPDLCERCRWGLEQCWLKRFYS